MPRAFFQVQNRDLIQSDSRNSDFIVTIRKRTVLKTKEQTCSAQIVENRAGSLSAPAHLDNLDPDMKIALDQVKRFIRQRKL